jgi:hypothetical protein
LRFKPLHSPSCQQPVKINTNNRKTNTRSTAPLKLVDHHPQLGLLTRHPAQDGLKVCVFFLGLHLGSMTSLYLLNQAWAKNTLSRRAIAASFLKSSYLTVILKIFFSNAWKLIFHVTIR